MKKNALIGSGGSGKSTLARKLGEKLDIDVFHLGAMFWKPMLCGDRMLGLPRGEVFLIQFFVLQ